MSRPSKADRPIRLSSAVKIVETITGERVHKSTLYRWADRGLKGVKLEVTFAGGHKRTTENLIREFFAKVSIASSCAPISTRSTNRKRLRAAARDLEKAGI